MKKQKEAEPERIREANPKEAEPERIPEANPKVAISEILQGKDKILGSDFEEIKGKQVKEEMSACLG
jgi:hypothetical protein